MGFKFNGKHSDDFGFAATLQNITIIPSKRQKSINVQGLDGQYIFEDSLDNVLVEFSCTIGSYDVLERRKKARAISNWLSTTGTLILDHESDVEYLVVKSMSDISASVQAMSYRDDFSVSFECAPYQRQTYYNDGLTWVDIDSAWSYMNIPWDGYERKFKVYSGQPITVYNAGDYKALPVIILTGTAASVTIGPFSLTNAAGTIYIDCKNTVVYSIESGKKINKIKSFSGDFPVLNPGANKFSVTGAITNLSIEFDYKNTYK